MILKDFGSKILITTTKNLFQKYCCPDAVTLRIYEEENFIKQHLVLATLLQKRCLQGDLLGES